jgi:hypothetical protein
MEECRLVRTEGGGVRDHGHGVSIQTSAVSALRLFFFLHLFFIISFCFLGISRSHSSPYIYVNILLSASRRHMVGAALGAGRGTLPLPLLGSLLSLPRGAPRPPAPRTPGGQPCWQVVPAKGLSLHHVTYPPHGDPTILQHPELPHRR